MQSRFLTPQPFVEREPVGKEICAIYSYKFAIMEPNIKPDVKTTFAFKMKAGSF